MITVASWVLGTLAVALVLLSLLTTFLVITWATRGMPVQRVRRPGNDPAHSGADGASRRQEGQSPYQAGSDEFKQVARVLSKTPLSDGHQLRYFFAGDELYDALFEDVSRATRLVTWHVFWFKPGRLAERVADALAERARAGVPVLLLLDYFGSKGIGSDYIERLRAYGVEVAVFRPPRWNNLYKAQHRMHIRAVVVDGTIGYTGGFAIDDNWLGDGRHPGQWRDTSVRLEGEAVDQLQGAFVANWAEATGELLLGRNVFGFNVEGRHQGPHTAGLLYSSPSLGSTVAERFFFNAIASARERCWLTTAYFVPNRQFRRLLCQAADRGIDVRVLTPGGNTDRASTWYASRAHYGELLDGGVQLYEYKPTMMHAKTLVVDGVLSMVGTLNFDNRSMVLNDEVGLLISDRELGSELEGAFRDDIEYAQQITAELENDRTTAVDRLRMIIYQRFSRLL